MVEREREKCLLAVLHGCNQNKINDMQTVLFTLNYAAKLMGVTPVKKIVHKFYLSGISAVLIVKESIMEIDTYPEHSSAIVHLRTCNMHSNMNAAFEYIKSKLCAKSAEIIFEGYVNLVKK